MSPKNHVTVAIARHLDGRRGNQRTSYAITMLVRRSQFCWDPSAEDGAGGCLPLCVFTSKRDDRRSAQGDIPVRGGRRRDRPSCPC